MNSNQRILITGSGGQLGSMFKAILGHDDRLLYADSSQLDVRDAGLFNKTVLAHRADVVINCSGYTAVDKAEAEHDLAFELNGRVPGEMARICAASGARLVHFSTDYVFDGNSRTPYSEQDATHPISVYGASKREGEERILSSPGSHLVIRVSWLYSIYGKNFVKTMMKLASEGKPLNVVNDQEASPTFAGDLVHAVMRMLGHGQSMDGLFHFTNSGLASWFDFADELLRPVFPELQLSPVQTGFFETAAERPRYSKLDTSKFSQQTGMTPRNWKLAMNDCRVQLLAKNIQD